MQPAANCVGFPSFDPEEPALGIFDEERDLVAAFPEPARDHHRHALRATRRREAVDVDPESHIRAGSLPGDS